MEDCINNKTIPLGEGESIIFRTRVHSLLILSPAILIILSLIFLPNSIVAFIFGVVLFLVGIFQYSYYQYFITNKRFIKKSGYYHIKTEEIPLDKIDNVLFWQSWSHKILGTGDVILLGSGITRTSVKGLSKARDFRNALQSQLPTEHHSIKD